MTGLDERLRQQAKEAREAARLAADPLVKARLHEIANMLEKLARELDSDPSA